MCAAVQNTKPDPSKQELESGLNASYERIFSLLGLISYNKDADAITQARQCPALGSTTLCASLAKKQGFFSVLQLRERIRFLRDLARTEIPQMTEKLQNMIPRLKTDMGEILGNTRIFAGNQHRQGIVDDIKNRERPAQSTTPQQPTPAINHISQLYKADSTLTTLKSELAAAEKACTDL